MAYNNFAEDLITGLGQFSQGYMQGQREREDRAMRQQQFDQQQKMAGLQYDMLKQREVQNQALQKYADAAQAVLMGDYGTAKQLHNELGGNEVESIEPIDNDNLRIRYSDGAKESIIPKTEYTQVVASRGNPERMINAINSIAQNQRMREMAKTSAEAKAGEAERTRQFKSEEAEKARAAKETEWKAKFQTQYDIAKMRAATAGRRGGAGGGLSAFEKKFNLYKTQLMENQGLNEQDASNEALRLSTPGADTDRTKRGDQIRILKTLVEQPGQVGRDAKQQLADLGSEVASGRKPKQSSAAPSAPKAGMVRNGWRFKGGDPANKNNWEKM